MRSNKEDCHIKILSQSGNLKATSPCAAQGDMIKISTKVTTWHRRGINLRAIPVPQSIKLIRQQPRVSHSAQTKLISGDLLRQAICARLGRSEEQAIPAAPIAFTCHTRRHRQSGERHTTASFIHR